ncbi:helix-turn-helix transcriptional regulator [Paraburkholderia aspalathi]|uniref:helix-turn-helix transcriptional regulator n=1 Tax=Paraburkholderia aspalathi TaxID=1324617 RepID=UPI001B19096C|nr:transcriptional regulator [Paraburkholderia aspalathi]CAE6826797.1 hypothetical protein R20943_06440 [Paraburkholderia aspalathi]
MPTALHEETQSLPLTGLSRWAQLKRFLPVGYEHFRRLGKAGLAPRPKRLSHRCAVYENAEIHRWLADPAAYRADTQNTGE